MHARYAYAMLVAASSPKPAAVKRLELTQIFLLSKLEDWYTQ